MTKDDIRQTLHIIYGQVFNEGRAELYPGLVSVPYIQHNPLVADGVRWCDGISQGGRFACPAR